MIDENEARFRQILLKRLEQMLEAQTEIVGVLETIRDQPKGEKHAPGDGPSLNLEGNGMNLYAYPEPHIKADAYCGHCGQPLVLDYLKFAWKQEVLAEIAEKKAAQKIAAACFGGS